MKTLKYLTLGATSALCLLVQTGCTTVNTVENADPVAQRHFVSDKRITSDKTLYNRVRVISINDAVTPAGFYKIQLEVMNTTNHRHAFTYKVEWFDENGMIINSPTSTAMPRQLEGKETASITAIAPTDKARDFRIKLLEPVD